MLQKLKDALAILLGNKIAVDKDSKIAELEKEIEEIYQLTINLNK